MKVLIVSGFLGAGKTSFIRHMTDTLLDVDFVIFENEIGETDIDVKVLQEGERSLNVYEMTEFSHKPHDHPFRPGPGSSHRRAHRSG